MNENFTSSFCLKRCFDRSPQPCYDFQNLVCLALIAGTSRIVVSAISDEPRDSLDHVLTVVHTEIHSPIRPKQCTGRHKTQVVSRSWLGSPRRFPAKEQKATLAVLVTVGPNYFHSITHFTVTLGSIKFSKKLFREYLTIFPYSPFKDELKEVSFIKISRIEEKLQYSKSEEINETSPYKK